MTTNVQTGLEATLALRVGGFDRVSSEGARSALDLWHQIWVLLEEQTDRHRGNRLNMVAQAIYAARFVSALDALCCAINMHRGFAARFEAPGDTAPLYLHVSVCDDESLSGEHDRAIDEACHTMQPDALYLSPAMYDRLCAELEAAPGSFDIWQISRERLSSAWNSLPGQDSPILSIGFAQLAPAVI